MSMSEKQMMCTVMDLPTSTLASLFAALMFTEFHNQFPLLTMLLSQLLALSDALIRNPAISCSFKGNDSSNKRCLRSNV